MTEFKKTGKVGLAAMKAGMDRKTAGKYVKLGRLPSELKKPRTWRTRADPFERDWPDIREILQDVPEIEAAVVLDHLIGLDPARYQETHLRTLQRRLKRWRAEEGPPKRVFFPQDHRPGEAMQTDFTTGKHLGITICGEPFDHLLCHPVLPYSNWEWITVCQSESIAALKRGVQEALFELEHVPLFHQTDNSTAATHDLRTGKRGFNKEYAEMMAYFGVRPRTTQVGEKEQNGDVESLHGVLKRRIRQLLRLRRSFDFDSVRQYELWLQEVVRKANRGRQRKLSEELAVMKPLLVRRLPEYTEEDVRVSQWSTIRCRFNTYSVPSRLIGERLRVRVFDDRLELYYGQRYQFTVERLRGKGGHRINYRHIISSLVKKPGAFERYKYREDLFPSITFRKAYDRLLERLPQRRANIEYLRCLQLAAETMESEVEEALSILLEAGEIPVFQQVEELAAPRSPQMPKILVGEVDLKSYDLLLGSEVREVAS